MTEVPIAVQLYSVREDAAKDLPGVLKAIAGMGFDGVEFAGYYNYDAKTLRNMLDGMGLKAAGTHTALSTLMGDNLEKTVEFNLILGNKFLIVPSLPLERTESKEAWLKTAALFNQIDRLLVPYGVRTGYHNHHTEFAPIGGELPWDIFFSNTDKRVVMQFDTGNALHGGGEAIKFLESYPGRAATVHLKDYSATDPDVLLGEGDVPLKRVVEVCKNQGATEWYIIEQETYKFPPMECIEKCLKNFRSLV